MGLPDIIIEFSKKAVTAIQNGSTGDSARAKSYTAPQ